MPLGLLLQSAFGTWQKDVAKLAGWNQLVGLEDTLLARARGAFMGRWFGGGVPMFAGDVRIAIGNLDELRARYTLLRREAMRNTADLNLTEPLAGIAGTMVGALLSPTSSMVLMAVIAEQLPKLTTTLAAAVNWLTYGALGIVILAVGVPVLAVGMPLAAFANRDDLAVGHRFLGALAGLFVAARTFLEQLLGPRERVRNPLLGPLLNVLDHLATLVPFVFALAAFVVTWIGPKLASLSDYLDHIIPLARAVFDVLATVLRDLFEKLDELYAGKHSPLAILQGIIRSVGQWLTLVTDQFTALFDIAKPAFEDVTVLKGGKKTTEMRAWYEVKRALSDTFDKLMPFILEMTRDSWLVKRLKEVFSRLGRIADILKGPDGKKSGKKSGWVVRHLKEAAPSWPSTLNFPATPTIADFPDAADMFNLEEWLAGLRSNQPDVTAAFAKPDGGFVFVLDPDASKALTRLRRPPFDVFAAERQALLKNEKPQDILEKAQLEEARLRTLLFGVIDHLLPPAVADEIPKLQGLLWELDTALYQKKAAFPVRDLPGGDRLSLTVGKLRVRAPGQKDRIVRTWTNDLKTALEKQVYRTERSPAA